MERMKEEKNEKGRGGENGKMLKGKNRSMTPKMAEKPGKKR
jgi:hypothetical protein